MDNHGSYTTIEFITFCEEHFIIPFYFLPHTTHLCQPLDGQAFQCLKHYFRKENSEVVMLNTKLINDIEQMEYQSQRVKRHIQRSMDANALLVQELDLAHKSAATTIRNGKSILGSRGSVLSPLSANRKIVKRLDADSKKLQRLQARHAKDLEAEQQAQAARDLLESKHEASMAARDSIDGN
ncbi:hypothetical protein N7537_001751, partial [Penicillium hordei]